MTECNELIEQMRQLIADYEAAQVEPEPTPEPERKGELWTNLTQWNFSEGGQNLPDEIAEFGGVRVMNWMTDIDEWSQMPHESQSDRLESTLSALFYKGVKKAWLTFAHDITLDEAVECGRVASRYSEIDVTHMEGSNEYWNGAQSWVQEGVAAHDGDWTDWYRSRALYDIEIMRAFADAYNRPVEKVLNVQAANTFVATQALQADDGEVDAIAVGSYFGGRGDPMVEDNATDFLASNEAYTSFHLNRWLEAMVKSQAIAGICSHRALADAYGVKLLAYEGGGHIGPAYPATVREGLERRLGRNTTLAERIAEADRQTDIMIQTARSQTYANSVGEWARRAVELCDGPVCNYSLGPRSHDQHGTWGSIEPSGNRLVLDALLKVIRESH